MLIFAKSLGGGGSEVALIQLLNKLPRDKYDVTLALLENDSEYAYRLKVPVNIVYIQFKNYFYQKLVSTGFVGKVLKKLKINKYIHFYDWLFNKVSTQFNDRYDIAIDFYGYGYFLTAYLAMKINADRKATWLHDENISWFKNVERYAKHFHKIFGVSQAVCDSFIKTYPQYKDKVKPFYNVIDVEEIIKKSEEECGKLFDGKYNILTVGRLHKQKGYDIAVEAARILVKKGIDFKWYAIGSGPEEKRLRGLIKKYNLLDIFILLGRKDNPYIYMKQCNLYVQPSRHEGYGITLAEAKTLCLPIIASDIPPIHEQLKDGVNGYIVPLNAEAFTDKMYKLITEPDLAEKVVRELQHNKLDFSSELTKLENI